MIRFENRGDLSSARVFGKYRRFSDAVIRRLSNDHLHSPPRYLAPTIIDDEQTIAARLYRLNADGFATKKKHKSSDRLDR